VSEELNHIDNLFRDVLKDVHIAPPASAWSAVQSGMSAKSSLGWLKSGWLWTSLATVSIATGVYIVSSSVKVENKVEKDGVKKEVEIQPNPGSNDKIQNNPIQENKYQQNAEFVVKLPKTDKSADEATADKPLISPRNKANNEHFIFENPLQEKGIGEKSFQQSPTLPKVQPCRHLLRISAADMGNKSWKLSAEGAIEQVIWNLDQKEEFTGAQILIHQFEDQGVLHRIRVKALNVDGCMDTASFSLATKTENGSQDEFFIPDYLTPNADGINDDLSITLGKVTEYNLLVFDKNNRQVFVSNSPENSWTGKSGYLDCEAGVYTVVLSFKPAGSNERKVIRKSVWLTREK
jgi:hypothetical protein